MDQKAPSSNRRIQTEQSDAMNPYKLLRMILNNWFLFIISILISIVLAFLYIKYTIPTFRVTTTVLIEEGDRARIQGMDRNMLEGFGLSPAARNMENQLYLLTSWTLIHETLEELNFNTDCYRKGLLRKMSLYPLYPIHPVPGPDGKVPYNTEFSFQYIEGNVFKLSANSKSIVPLDTFITFGQLLSTEQGSFTILPSIELEKFYKSKEKFYFKFYDPETLTEHYRQRLIVEPASKDGTIIKITLQGTNKTKDKIFLDKLVEVFMARNLQKKNHEANRIIEFIDSQLGDVSDSLMITENKLQEFRSRNRIMDVSSQAQQIINQSVVLENERAKLMLESNYYEYLDGYLSKQNNQEIPISPATMGIEDPLLARLMQELAALQSEYFSSGVGEKNPLQAQLELKISNTKQSIRETLQGIKLANSMALEENKHQIETLNAQATRLPEKERQLLGIERKFNLNNILYTFLLQERAEAQIQKASNKPDNELIDPAKEQPEPVSPNSRKAYLFSISLGVVIPFLLLLLSNTISNNINSEEELRLISSLPIVGHIPHSRLSYQTVVLTEPQSRIAEAFRSLRTRMEFFTQDARCPVILVTSTMPGEGKTFTAINLASAYSIAGKKTLLIGFDLRRPAISTSFGLNGEVGLSNYLIGKNAASKIIFETDYPNLYLIPSGPIPPNPGELSNSVRAKDLLLNLREQFDFIIVDSTPIGIVSDNYSIASVADAIIVLVRHGQTKKNLLSATLTEIQANEIGGLSLVINDIKSKKGSYRYAYNYKYGEKYLKSKR